MGLVQNIVKESSEYGKYIFIFYLIIAGNYINDLFGCNIKKILVESMLAKHVAGYFTLLFFVVFSGNQNRDFWYIIRTTVSLYLIFIISTSCDKMFIMPFLILLCISYALDIYKTSKEDIKPETVVILEKAQRNLFLLSMIIVIYGMIKYANQKHREYRGTNFSWVKFFLGVPDCKSI